MKYSANDKRNARLALRQSGVLHIIGVYGAIRIQLYLRLFLRSSLFMRYISSVAKESLVTMFCCEG